MERLLPKKILAIAGIAASLSLGAFEVNHQQYNDQKIHWSGDVGVFQEKDSFQVMKRNGNRYDFTGQFNGINERDDALIVGAKQGRECAVAIILPDEIVTIYEEAIAPYRVDTITNDSIGFHTFHDYTYFTKSFNRDTGEIITTSEFSIPYPWYTIEPC